MLNHHRRSHDERRDIDRVFGSKVLDPKEEGSMPHLNRILKCIVKGNEYRDLDQHRKAPTHGVNLSPFVEQHDLLLNPCLVVLVGFFESGHFRLYLLHPLHRFETDLCEGQKDDFDQYAENEDIDPKIFRNRIGELQQPDEGFCDDCKPTKIDQLFCIDTQGF